VRDLPNLSPTFCVPTLKRAAIRWILMLELRCTIPLTLRHPGFASQHIQLATTHWETCPLPHSCRHRAEYIRLLRIPSWESSPMFPNRRPCRSSAVRRGLPPAAAQVRVRAACGVCGGQSGTGAGFLRVLRFHLPIIPPISPLS
jgi:hypothetical protein